MANGKDFADYAAEVLELIPTIVATGISIEQAVTWAQSKLASFKGGKVPSDADWQALADYRATMKARLVAGVEKLVAGG